METKAFIAIVNIFADDNYSLLAVYYIMLHKRNRDKKFTKKEHLVRDPLRSGEFIQKGNCSLYRTT